MPAAPSPRHPRRPRWAARAGLLLGTLALAGCVYAPPVRSVHYGAPGLIGANERAIQASFSHQTDDGLLSGSQFNHWSGGVNIAYPLAQGLHFEGSGDFSDSWAVANGGLRLTSKIAGVRDANVRRGAYFDLDLGLGGGVGGHQYAVTGKGAGLQVAEVGSPWTRPVLGVRGGAGIGWWISNEWAVFARGQAQDTWAADIDATRFLTVVAGPQARFGAVGGYCAIGLWKMCMDGDCGGFGHLVECGLSVSLPGPAVRTPVAAPEDGDGCRCKP